MLNNNDYSKISPEIQNIMNALNVHLQWRSKNGPPRGHLVYHPSSFGRCLRKMQYELYEEMGYIKGEHDKKSNETLRIFDTGHSMHNRWANYFSDIGVLRGYWHCKNKMCYVFKDDGSLLLNDICNSKEFYQKHGSRKYGYDNLIGCHKPKSCVCGCSDFDYHEISVENSDLNFHGHADQILDFSNFDVSLYKTGNPVDILFNPKDLPKYPIVVDMKTINSRDFDGKLQEKMHFEYKVQLTIYINILKLEKGVLIYENKDNSRVKIFEVNKNPELWKKIQEQASTMKSMIDSKKLPPPRPKAKSSIECRYCPFKSKCHGEDGTKSIWDHPDLSELREKFYGDFE